MHNALLLIALSQCIKFHLIPIDTFRDMLWKNMLLQNLGREIRVITCDGLLFLHSALSLMGLTVSVSGFI